MSIEVMEEIAPSYWASYLINGDDSDLSEAEKDVCDAWCKGLEPAYVVDTKEGEHPSFSWNYRLYGGDAQGGEVCTYILHRQRRKYTRKVKG